MAISPFASPLWSGLYGDAEMAALFADSAEVRAMLMVEGALAKAQAHLGLIPEEAADAIQRAAVDAVIDPAALAAGTAGAGVPVPALVDAFRTAVGDREAAAYAHWGATSQDIVDTGLVLRLRRAFEILDTRLARLIALLADRAEEHRETVMAARTRGQTATPTTLGARIATWGWPLIRSRGRLVELRPRVLVVSLGGASGTRSAFQGRGAEVAAGLAEGLGLGIGDGVWHAARDGIVETGGWAALVTGSLGKIGADLMHLGQSELGEVRAGVPGGSSTMPHKQNPVGAEVLVQLATAAPTALAGLHAGMIHQSERDGVAWAQEWLHLPQLLFGAARGLSGAIALAQTLSVDHPAMARPFAAHQGAMFAEAATFALAAHMPRPEAQALVKEACARARETGTSLRRILETECAAPVVWDDVFDPLAQAGDAPALADAFVTAARQNFTS